MWAATTESSISMDLRLFRQQILSENNIESQCQVQSCGNFEVIFARFSLRRCASWRCRPRSYWWIGTTKLNNQGDASPDFMPIDLMMNTIGQCWWWSGSNYRNHQLSGAVLHAEHQAYAAPLSDVCFVLKYLADVAMFWVFLNACRVSGPYLRDWTTTRTKVWLRIRYDVSISSNRSR